MDEKLLHLFLNMGQSKDMALQESARQLHDIYESYLDAGFNQKQAFELVKTMLCQAIAIGVKR